ncbi:MAG: hypothetical protein JWN39_2732, partial [Ilumatobacteraceae bacterium]|nr:hypothetical protein [Ilumatobacteraceae bacterium]
MLSERVLDSQKAPAGRRSRKPPQHRRHHCGVSAVVALV